MALYLKQDRSNRLKQDLPVWLESIDHEEQTQVAVVVDDWYVAIIQQINGKVSLTVCPGIEDPRIDTDKIGRIKITKEQQTK